MRKLVLISGTLVILLGGNLFAQQDSTWSIGKCISYAYNKNIQVRKSEIANQRYGEYAAQAEAQKYPSLNAGLSQNFNWSKSTGSGSNGLTGNSGSNYSLSSGLTVFNAGRINNQIKQAKLDMEGGVYSLETTKESISLNILNAYLQVLYAEELVKNSKKQIESTEQQLNLASERLILKVISTADFAQVKSQLASEKLTLANSESQLAIAKVSLMQIMELPVTSDFNIEHPVMREPLNEKRLPVVKAVFETAVSIKPQVKGAAINKEIASLDEKIAKASYMPVLTASAGMSSSYSTRLSDQYLSQLNNGISPSAGFSLSVPIYQKRQAKTSMAIAKIGYQDAELSETDTKNLLRKSIEQACQDVTSAQIKYEASVENYNAMKESFALSEEKFKQGIINSVDYLVSKTNLIVSESELLQSKYSMIFSYKVLDFYAGIPVSL